MIELARPAALAAAVLALWPALAAWRARRQGGRISPAGAVARALAVVLVAAALAGPSAPLGDRAELPWLILRDVSGSCRGQGERLELGPGVPAQRYDFAAELAPTIDPPAPDPRRTRPTPALVLALARRDALAGVVLHTDGRFGHDRWRSHAAALGRTALPVAVVAMDDPPPDVRVAELVARRGDDGVAVRVSVAAGAPAAARLTVRRVRPAGAELLARDLHLTPGTPFTVRLADGAPPDRLAVYRAEIDADDAFPENDAAEAAVLPRRGSVALVGGGAAAAEAIAAATARDVRRRPADAAPRDPAGWADHDAVVLLDASGKLLPPPARAALAEYVRRGGGLVLVGAGPHAAPEDRRDPLNRVAALTPNPYQRRPLAVAVVLDASGSMAEPADEPNAPAGRLRFGQAADAVLSLRRHLTDADALSVIAFSDSARRIYAAETGRIDFARLGEALAGVVPAGPTDVRSALELAADRPPAPGRDGLVLVVSDLLTRPFPPAAAAEALREAGLSLAIVAVASEAATRPGPSPLEALAARLEGATVLKRRDLAGLADVFASLLHERRGRPLRRGAFSAAMVRPFGRVPAGALGAVGGYVLSAAGDNADVLARVGPDADPIAAARRAGAGRSVALAVAPEDLAAWPDDPTWRELLAAAVRWAARPEGDRRFDGQLDADPGGLTVTVTASDANRPINGLGLTARLAAVEGDPPAARMRQIAPGRYEARLPPAAAPGAVTVAADDRGVVWSHAVTPGAAGRAEFARIGPDRETLAELARRAGGRLMRPGELPALGRRIAERSRTPLWPVLLGLATAVMLAEWALGRRARRAA